MPWRPWPGSGLHPDAVASRVRELRAEWQRLDASEAFPATEKGQRPTQAWHAASTPCATRALKPARGYFDKRDELRKAHEQVIAALIERAGSANESADRATCSALRGEVVAALRQLDGVDPRQRKALAQQLRTPSGASTRDWMRSMRPWSRPSALIARAGAGRTNSPTGRRRASCAELQQRWKEAGSARRQDDRALWNDFRAVCDRVFGGLDTQRRERAERRTAGLADASRRGSAGGNCAARPSKRSARGGVSSPHAGPIWTAATAPFCRARWQRAAEALDAAEAARAATA